MRPDAILVRIRHDRERTERGLYARVRYERDIAMALGEQVRQWRNEKQIGLREFARRVGLSPTFVSKFERGEFAPPGEEKLRTIARLIERNVDEILALANKVSSDLPEIIRQNPREMAELLRAAKDLEPEQIIGLTDQVKKMQAD